MLCVPPTDKTKQQKVKKQTKPKSEKQDFFFNIHDIYGTKSTGLVYM